MRRQIVLILAAAVLTAPSPTSLAHHQDGHDGGEPPKSFTTTASSTRHWGFGFYFDVPASKIRPLIPPGFTLEACRPDGSPLLPDKAHVVLIINEEDELHGDTPLHFARFAIVTCGRPPEDGRQWYRTSGPSENTRLIALRAWENSETHIKFLKDVKQVAEYADITFLDDPSNTEKWSFEARANGILIAAASFEHPTGFESGLGCREFDEILRLWTYDAKSRAYGTFDADLMDLKACYGSPTAFVADPASPVAELLGTRSQPTLAGVERHENHKVTYSRLF